jgi:hypothetical protein
MANLTIASLRIELYDSLGYTLKINTKGLKENYKYVACYDTEEIFGANTLNEMLSLIKFSHATAIEQSDEVAIKLEAEKQAVIDMEPTQTSFQEIAVIFEVNGWGMTPDQTNEYYDKHWLSLFDKTEENLSFDDDLFCDWSIASRIPVWVTLQVVDNSEYVDANARCWRAFVEFSSTRWENPEEYREEMIICEEPNTEEDDREFSESSLFVKSCDMNGYCTVSSLPLLPEDIQTYPVTDIYAFIAACNAISEVFKGEDFYSKKYQPSSFKDMVERNKKAKVSIKGFNK